MRHLSLARVLFGLLAMSALAAGSIGGRARLPAIVLVSREPVPGGDPTVVPGLGPHHRALAPGGRLLVRERNGRIRELLPPGSLHDVSDPAVSFDARRIAFAGVPHQGGAWRIYVVNTDGTHLRRLTHDPVSRGAVSDRCDDLDPCWIGPRRLVFASTRSPAVAQYGNLPVTNLFLIDEDRGPRERLTSERNGAEEPTWDPESGRIVYARWWYNRHRPSDLEPRGITTDRSRAIPSDSANLWHAVSITPQGEDLKLAAGDPRSRSGMMAYQPAVLRDGLVVGVYARFLSMSPKNGGVGLQRIGTARARDRLGLPAGIGPAVRLAGPALDESVDAYQDTRGLAPPLACAPAALPDGRILFSYDPGGRGDFGLFVMRGDGSGLEPVLNLPQTLELDAAPIVARVPRRTRTASDVESNALESASRPNGGFVFHALNLHAQAPVDAPLPDAPPIGTALRMRFFGIRGQEALGGRDSAVELLTAPVSAQGEVHVENLERNVPMFEQLIDSRGRVLRATYGPAHVAGLNASSGRVARCVGCHAGHSAMPIPAAAEAAWFNVSPSAQVSASSTAPSHRAAALVDRRTRGDSWAVAWVSEGPPPQSVRLLWDAPIEARALVLHGLWTDPSSRNRSRVRACRLVLWRNGLPVGTHAIRVAPRPNGTRVEFPPTLADWIEVEVTRASGSTAGHAPVGLAEIEVIARVAARTPIPKHK